MKSKTTTGGARKGAGRKKKQPTVTMRVPMALVQTIKSLINKHNMKTLLLFLSIVVALSSFTHTEDAPAASVQKLYGVDIYAYSTPGRQYDVIDQGITNVVMGQCNGFVSRSAKKAFEKKGDGVILHFETFRYEIIKYTDDPFRVEAGPVILEK